MGGNIISSDYYLSYKKFEFPPISGPAAYRSCEGATSFSVEKLFTSYTLVAFQTWFLNGVTEHSHVAAPHRYTITIHFFQ